LYVGLLYFLSYYFCMVWLQATEGHSHDEGEL